MLCWGSERGRLNWALTAVPKYRSKEAKEEKEKKDPK